MEQNTVYFIDSEKVHLQAALWLKYTKVPSLDETCALQGWRQEFSDGGLTLPTEELRYGFQGTIDAKNLRRNGFSPSDGGASMLRRGLYPPSPPLVPPLEPCIILKLFLNFRDSAPEYS